MTGTQRTRQIKVAILLLLLKITIKLNTKLQIENHDF